MIVDLNWLEAAINNVSILVIILGSIPSIKDDREQIISPETAYQITSMLEGVVKEEQEEN